MEKIFGIELALILIVVLSLSFAATLTVLTLGATHKVLVKMGLRNIPRRPAQSILIILGLMLSTTIIGASLGIGDTVSYSIRKAALDSMGLVDETVRARSSNAYEPGFLDMTEVQTIRDLASKNSNIDGVIASMETVAPTLNITNDRTEARLVFRGYEVEHQTDFGTLLDVNGNVQTLKNLGRDETFLNKDAAQRLSATVGDELQVFTAAGVHTLSVRGVLQAGGLASGGGNPVALLPLSRLQTMLDRESEVDQVGISNLGDIEGGLELSDEVTGSLRVSLTDRAVANEMALLLRDFEPLNLLRDKAVDDALNETLASELNALIEELSANEIVSDEAIRLIGDGDLYRIVSQSLATLNGGDLVLKLDAKRRTASRIVVADIKKDSIELAQTIGGTVTTIFTIFGSFSIIVGLLLIFLVMVLLAAARSAEMGMARAIGLRRMHLVQIFTYEGWVYAIGSALIGTAVGILASLVLVSLLQRAIGVEEFSIYPKMTLRSIAITIGTGFILTLATVVVSAYRVSHLNIISAIRGVGEELVSAPQASWSQRLSGVVFAILGPIGILIDKRKRTSKLHLWVSVLIVCLPPIWIGRIIWRVVGAILPLLTQGWPLMILGVLVCSYGLRRDQNLLFDVGVALGILGTSFALSKGLNKLKLLGDSNLRISATLGAIGLLVYFGLPFDALESVTGKLEDGPEDFVLRGCIMVAAMSWLVMHNAEIFLWLLNKTIGRVAGLNAVFRIAVAYPVNSRFRTGLTITMFALVIFTLVINATLSNLNNVARDTPDRVTGGYDIALTITDGAAIDDFGAQLDSSSLVNPDEIETVGRSGNIRARLRQVDSENVRFQGIRAIVVDNSYLTTNQFELSHYDPAFGNEDTKLWQSLDLDDNSVLISNSAIVSDDPWGAPDGGFQIEGFPSGSTADSWNTIKIEVVPSWDEEATPLLMQVIGVVDPIASVGGGDDWDQSLFIVMGESTASKLIGESLQWDTYYVTGSPTADVPDLVAKLETVFLRYGGNATDLMEDIERSLKQEAAFNQLFQGFMGLGLFVGVCAIGVLAIRAVVERRQSIGVLRAIGYRPAMIQIQFLLESLFVTLLGVAIGLGLGGLISWNIFKAITKEVDGLTFAVPWTSILVITVLTSVFALLSGYWPARQASKISPAEALRYE
jgi:putative ABC transport system permease protein